MEMVETARIWYIDSGANVTFQLFGPIFGSILLAISKELTKKKSISPKCSLSQWPTGCGNNFPVYWALWPAPWQMLGLQVCKTWVEYLLHFIFLAGGYGKKLKRLSAGNKWNTAPAAYDEYDYYTSGTEHYVSFYDILFFSINIRMFLFVMIHMLMHVRGAFCGYNQAILCQKVAQPEHSVLFSMSNNFPSPSL